MMRWFGLASLLLPLLCACDVASVREAPSAIAHNQCQSDAECGGGTCVDKQCRVNTGTFQSVLLEVTPPADNSAISGVQFLVPTELVAGGETTVALGQIAQVTGRVTAKKRSCKPRFGAAGNEVVVTSDTSMPAQLSLIPVTEKLGLYSPRAVVQSEVDSAATFFGYSVNIPPGSYDIYIEPKSQPDESCAIPPQIVLAQEIKAGAKQLDFDLAEPSMFEFHVYWSPGADTLDGWMVDMLAPASGQVISNRIPLVDMGKTSDGKTDYKATLTYSSVTVNGKPQPDQDQLLRLSPPSDLPVTEAKPTVLMARSALGLFKAGSGTLTALSSLPSPVHVVGQVTSVGQAQGGAAPRPVAATVTLAATEIEGIDKGVLVSFVRTVTVSDDGLPFDVYLLPGKYRVSTVPKLSLDPSNTSDTTFAADVRSWTVPSAPSVQQGKLIELNPALALSGQVLDASNNPVTSAQVQASASPLSIARPDFLRESLEGTAFVPRATAGGVSSSGNFALKTDPGTFDITVRTNSDTGFAWLVMPNVVVPAPNGFGLNTIRMPLPFPYSGTVAIADSTDVVPGALIRAYLYLKDGAYTKADDANANSLLQVAETRAGKDGKFEILIPAELN